MLSIRTIQNEISQIPINRLEEVYQLIRSFHRPIKEKTTKKSKLLNFAGLYSDMSDSDYNDLILYTKKSRNNLFSRNESL